MDREPRSRVCPQKGARDRLIVLAEAHPERALGFCDETWWSRFERPALHSWSEDGQPLRLVEQPPPKDDPNPKALAAYGMLVRSKEQGFAGEGSPEEGWQQQVCLGWCCNKLAAAGKKAPLLIWDNASWHKSKFVKDWIVEHNRRVKTKGEEVRIVACFLPEKSPWLNPIEPMGVHAKRKVMEPEGLLGEDELADRICGVFGCSHEEYLSIYQEVA